MRILINECKQEISSFNPVPSTYDDFLVHHGADVLNYHRPVRSEPGGAIQVFEERGGIELIGGFSAKGITSAGTLSREGFRRIAEEFLAPVRTHHKSVDALYFALKDLGLNVHRVGDAVACRKLDHAIYEGYLAGRELFDPRERYIYEGELEREEATLVHGD